MTRRADRRAVAPRLLVVDDEYAIRFSLESYFGERGFTVATAASIEGALERLRHDRFDAAIIDIRLPDGSGEALISVAHGRHPDLRFLIYTGSVDYRISPALRAIGIGDDQVLIKPVVDMNDLLSRVNALLDDNKD